MKQRFKRCLSVFLAITIIFGSAYVGINEIDFKGLFAVKAEAASESDLVFTLNDDGESYSVTDCDVSAEGELIIPNIYNGLSVTGIGYSAFYNCTNITSIIIPRSVTNIGNSAFYKCTNLTTITVDDNNANFLSVDGILFNRDATTLIKYPEGKLNTEYTIPDSVTSIGDDAFDDCSGLTSISIPDSVTSIGDSAFTFCSNLTFLTIPSSIKNIGINAFVGCTNLMAINISNIGAWCNIDFENEASNPMYYTDTLYLNGELLTDVVIPDGITKIPFFAFEGCDSITSITIPDSVTDIGEYAFSNCGSLFSVKIGNKVSNIGKCAFKNCSSLTSVYITDIDAWCNIDFSFNYYEDFGYVFSNPLWCACNLYINGELATDIVIPDSVTSINSGVFYNCTSLISITISNSVKSIGRYSFYNCTGLSTINIPEGVTTIGERAFENCISLNEVTISDSVKSIGARAFGSCDNLESVVVGLGVENIGGGAFYLGVDNKYLNVFYKGTKEQWGKINKGSEYVDLCKMHYETIDHTPGELIINNATVYKSGYQYKECTQCGKVFEKEVFPQLKCSKAKLSKISNATSGVKITWGKVEGADSYIIYRKTKGGSWNNIGSTSKTNFTDKTAKSGTTYYYAIKVRNEAGNSDLSTSLSIKRLSVPKLSATSNTSSGVKVTWKKVTGASGYIVYRKTKSGDWKEIGKTTKLYYTDKKAKSGTSYYYSVRAYSGSVKSYYNTDGLSIRRLVAPKISSATSKSEGILVKWNKITGASGYYVYRKASSGEWKKIDTVKGNTKVKYLDESPRKGATYQYRVKAYYSKSTSYNSNSYKIKCKY